MGLTSLKNCACLSISAAPAIGITYRSLALPAAANSVWTGWKLLYRSTQSLLDVALPSKNDDRVVAVLSRYRA